MCSLLIRRPFSFEVIAGKQPAKTNPPKIKILVVANKSVRLKAASLLLRFKGCMTTHYGIALGGTSSQIPPRDRSRLKLLGHLLAPDTFFLAQIRFSGVPRAVLFNQDKARLSCRRPRSSSSKRHPPLPGTGKHGSCSASLEGSLHPAMTPPALDRSGRYLTELLRGTSPRHPTPRIHRMR